MKKLRIALPTKGNKGLDDEVSEIFGKTKTITVIEVINGKVKVVKIIQNPASSYRFGAGPIVVKTLADMGISTIIAGELGPGASALLEDNNIRKVTVKPGIKVKEAIAIAVQQFTNTSSNGPKGHKYLTKSKSKNITRKLQISIA